MEKQQNRQNTRLVIITRLLLMALTVAVVAAGCSASKGFNPSIMKESFDGDKVPVTDEEIARLLALKPQIKQPFHLGIYLKSRYYSWSQLDMDSQDAGGAWIKELKSSGIVNKVTFISPLTVARDDLMNIRMGAARHQVDAVLVVDSASDVDRYNNFLSVLYLTIIGLFIVPGTHADSLVLVKGALWDVRNEYLYLTVEGEGRASKIGTAVLLDDIDSLKIARKNALDDFIKNTLISLKTLKGNQ